MESMELQIARCAVESGLIKEEDIWEADEIQKFCMDVHLKLPLSQIILKKYLPKIEHRNLYLTYLIEKTEILQIKEYLDPYMMELGSFWDEAIVSESSDASTIDTVLAKKLQTELRDLDIFVSIPYLLLLKKKNKWENKQNLPYMSTNRRINLEYFCERNRGKDILPLNASIHQLTRSILSLIEVEEANQIQKDLDKKNLSLPLVHILIERYSIEAYLLHALLLSQIYCEHNSVEIRWNKLCLQKIRMPAGFIPKIKAAQLQCAEFLQSAFKLSWLNFKAKEQLEILKILEKKVSKQNWNESVDIANNLQEKKLPLSLLKILCLSNIVSKEDLLQAVLTVVYKVPEEKIPQAMQNCEESFLKEAPAEEKMDEEKPEEQKSPEKEPEIIKVALEEKDALGQTMAISLSHLRKKKALPKKEASEVKEASETKEIPAQEEEKKASTTSSRIHLSEDMLRIRMALEENLLETEDLIRVLWENPEKGTTSVWEILKEKHYISQEDFEKLNQRPLLSIFVASTISSSPNDLEISKFLNDYKVLEREQLQHLFRLQNTLKNLGISISLEELILKTKLMSPEMLYPLVERKENLKKESAYQPLSQTSRIDGQNLSKKLNQTMQLVLPVQKSKKTALIVTSLGMIAICLFYFFALSSPYMPKKPATPVIKESTPEKTIEKPVDTKPVFVERNTPSESIEKPLQKIEVPKTLPPILSNLSLENAKIIKQTEKISVQGNFVSQPVLKEKLKVHCSLWDYRKKNKTAEQMVLCSSNFAFTMTKIPSSLRYGFYYVRLYLSPDKDNSWLTKEYEWWIPFVFGSAEEIKKTQKKYFQEWENRAKKLQEIEKELSLFIQNDAQNIKHQWKSFSTKWNKKYQDFFLELQEYHRNSWSFWDVSFTQETLEYLEEMQKGFTSLEEWIQGLSLIFPTFETKDFLDKWQKEIIREKESQENLLSFLKQKN